MSLTIAIVAKTLLILQPAALVSAKFTPVEPENTATEIIAPADCLDVIGIRHDWENHRFMAYDQETRKDLFEVYMVENGPDEIRDSLFRIVKKGKIGYANEYGQIPIKPKYPCAYPFENGKAKVACECDKTTDQLGYEIWESDEWFYIDRSGKKVE